MKKCQLKLKYLLIVTLLLIPTILPCAEDARIIYDNVTMEIFNPKKAMFKISAKILIVNKAGVHHGKIVVEENNYQKMKKLEGRIYDSTGVVIKEIKKKDIITGNYFADFVLYDDLQYQWTELSTQTFPYVLEYDIVKEIQNLCYWPDWDPISSDSVESASYTLILHQPIEFNTFAIGMDKKPNSTTIDGDKTIYCWEQKNISPRTHESYISPENRIQKQLLFTAKEFQFESYSGSNESWDSFARWEHRLWDHKCALLPATAAKINEWTSSCRSDREKVATLYSWLQKNTRYVAIEAGLQGFQPFPAQDVFDTKYGDCKALSALMVAMLKEVNIKAHPVLIKTYDRSPMRRELVSAQFNHVITCVPFPNDTIWLECTANTLPAGELPTNDEKCDVLVLHDNTGTIVTTPASHAMDNTWRSCIRGRLTYAGMLFFNGAFSTTGNQAIFWRGKFFNAKADERERFVKELLALYQPSIVLKSYEFLNLEDNFDRPFTIKFNGEIEKFGARSGNRLFINPNMLNRKTADDIPREEKRVFPVYLHYPYFDADTLSITLPTEFGVEALLEPTDIVDPLWHVQITATTSPDGQTITYIRNVEFSNNEIPLEKYPAFVDLLKTMVKQDRSKIVLKRAE
jgi:hypothetical protein